MSWIVSKTKEEFIGKRSFDRADTSRVDRKQLVGLLLDERVPEGTTLAGEGHVTSCYESAALGRVFGLGLLVRGRERHGETILADGVRAEVTGSVLYDPEGARRDGAA